MAFIWHSPRESRLHSASENACQPKIRRIVPELHVLYNVRGLNVYGCPPSNNEDIKLAVSRTKLIMGSNI